MKINRSKSQQKLIGLQRLSTLNPQVVHVDIFWGDTLGVGHAPVRGPKYSALFLAQYLPPQYKGAPPKHVSMDKVFRVVTPTGITSDHSVKSDTRSGTPKPETPNTRD